MDQSDFNQAVRMEHYRSGVQVTRETGILAPKTLITLNSGAFVVLFTFIGNAAAQSKYLVSRPYLRVASLSFLVGIFLAFLSIAYTHIVSHLVRPHPKPPKKTDGWCVPIIVGVTSLSFVVEVMTIAFGVEVPL